MIRTLVPNGVIAIEAYQARWETGLLPEERPLVARVEKRMREFAAGRNCARRVLAQLGWPDFPVLSGPNREPLWPQGVVGSITHCQGYCAAAAGLMANLDGITAFGIDAELNAPLPDSVIELVCTPWERRSLAKAPDATVLVFSAKESVYKAWFPIVGRWLGYQDAEIDFDSPPGRFAVRLLPSAPLASLPARMTFSGRFASTTTHVFTVVTVRTES